MLLANLSRKWTRCFYFTPPHDNAVMHGQRNIKLLKYTNCHTTNKMHGATIKILKYSLRKNPVCIMRNRPLQNLVLQPSLEHLCLKPWFRNIWTKPKVHQKPPWWTLRLRNEPNIISLSQNLSWVRRHNQRPDISGSETYIWKGSQ